MTLSNLANFSTIFSLRQLNFFKILELKTCEWSFIKSTHRLHQWHYSIERIKRLLAVCINRIYQPRQGKTGVFYIILYIKVKKKFWIQKLLQSRSIGLRVN